MERKKYRIVGEQKVIGYSLWRHPSLQAIVETRGDRDSNTCLVRYMPRLVRAHSPEEVGGLFSDAYSPDVFVASNWGGKPIQLLRGSGRHRSDPRGLVLDFKALPFPPVLQDDEISKDEHAKKSERVVDYLERLKKEGGRLRQLVQRLPPALFTRLGDVRFNYILLIVKEPVPD